MIYPSELFLHLAFRYFQESVLFPNTLYGLSCLQTLSSSTRSISQTQLAYASTSLSCSPSLSRFQNLLFTSEVTCALRSVLSPASLKFLKNVLFLFSFMFPKVCLIPRQPVFFQISYIHQKPTLLFRSHHFTFMHLSCLMSQFSQ